MVQREGALQHGTWRHSCFLNGKTLFMALITCAHMRQLSVYFQVKNILEHNAKPNARTTIPLVWLKIKNSHASWMDATQAGCLPLMQFSNEYSRRAWSSSDVPGGLKDCMRCFWRVVLDCQIGIRICQLFLHGRNSINVLECMQLNFCRIHYTKLSWGIMHLIQTSYMRPRNHAPND